MKFLKNNFLRSEEHTSELQSQSNLVCRLLLEKKSAFTGAHRRKLGQFEYANKGTIYLDEIADLPLALQAKLLHVLQDLRFSRFVGHGMIDVDIRVVAATNRDLEQALARGDRKSVV